MIWNIINSKAILGVVSFLLIAPVKCFIQTLKVHTRNENSQIWTFRWRDRGYCVLQFHKSRFDIRVQRNTGKVVGKVRNIIWEQVRSDYNFTEWLELIQAGNSRNSIAWFLDRRSQLFPLRGNYKFGCVLWDSICIRTIHWCIFHFWCIFVDNRRENRHFWKKVFYTLENISTIYANY